MRSVIIILIILSFFSCKNSSQGNKNDDKPGNWALLPFVKSDEVNPVLAPDPITEFFCPVRKEKLKWEEKDVFNPAAIVRNDTVFLLYRAEDKIGKFAGTSRIGLAWSIDGLHFTRHPSPILYPDNDSLKKYEWEGGCEDPRIVEMHKGTYYLTYTAYDGDKARLWWLHQPIFIIGSNTDLCSVPTFNNKYVNEWSKSGSIICKYEKGKSYRGKN